VVEPSSIPDSGPMPAWSKPLERVLGAGGFAVVWQVAGEATVLKVARASHDLARAQIAREAEALGAIGAPAVPRLHGHGVLPDGRAWIEMERVSGTNLGDLIATGQLKSFHVIPLGIRIAEALALIHGAGYAHRDLKPDNIVRRGDGSLVILDLGIARRLPNDPDDPNRGQIGSIEYMAPEQALDSTTARAPADIYALGCILYELCTGRLPFVGDAAALERGQDAEAHSCVVG
jgi:eukaryotic-like serine/threonine-protein kinase